MICIVLKEIVDMEGKDRLWKETDIRYRIQGRGFGEMEEHLWCWYMLKIDLDPGLEVILVEQNLNLKVQSLENSSWSLKIDQRVI